MSRLESRLESTWNEENNKNKYITQSNMLLCARLYAPQIGTGTNNSTIGLKDP
jgi:hypothetical protein